MKRGDGSLFYFGIRFANIGFGLPRLEITIKIEVLS
jgi:hypothetical protein